MLNDIDSRTSIFGHVLAMHMTQQINSIDYNATLFFTCTYIRTI